MKCIITNSNRMVALKSLDQGQTFLYESDPFDSGSKIRVVLETGCFQMIKSVALGYSQVMADEPDTKVRQVILTGAKGYTV